MTVAEYRGQTQGLTWGGYTDDGGEFVEDALNTMARAEAERRWTFPHGYDDGARAGFIAGAAWQREQATLPPVEDVARALAEHDGRLWSVMAEFDREQYRDYARAALALPPLVVTDPTAPDGPWQQFERLLSEPDPSDPDLQGYVPDESTPATPDSPDALAEREHIAPDGTRHDGQVAQCDDCAVYRPDVRYWKDRALRMEKALQRTVTPDSPFEPA